MKKGLKFASLVIGSIICLFPFYWMALASFRNAGDIFQFPPNLIPQSTTFSNYKEIWGVVPLTVYFCNSVIISMLTAVLHVFTASLTGFALARLKFRGKKALQLIVLAAIIMPREILMIPLFTIIVQAGLVDSVVGVVLPFAFDALAILLIRQAYMSIPREVEEAALIDGCKPLQMWWFVMQPMVKPTIVLIALFSAMGAWCDFMWPAVVLQSPENFTLQVGLQMMQGTFVNNFRFIAAGAVLSILPVFALFIAFQKHFVKGLFAGVGK